MIYREFIQRRDITLASLLLTAICILGAAVNYGQQPPAVQLDKEMEVDTETIIYNMGGIRGTVVGPADNEHPHQSEGTTIRLKDGSIMHAFNLRSNPPQGEPWRGHYVPTVIAYVTSPNSGKSWSKPALLLQGQTRTLSHPALVRLPNGELGITYNRIISETEATKVFRFSKDEGKNWSEEILISKPSGYWTSAHDRLLVLSSGRLIQPLHKKEVLLPEKMVTYVAWSDNNGKTWKIGKQGLIVGNIMPEYKKNFGNRRGDGFWEVSIAERSDKSLYMIGRTRTGFLYQSVSNDRGENWLKPTQTSLVSSEAPAVVVRVPKSRDLMLIWNSCCIDPKRSGLGLRLTISSVISSDNGKTWRDQREIVSVAPTGPFGTNDDGVSYPSVYIDGDMVYIGYYARMRDRAVNRGGGPQIVATLPLSWFYAARNYNHLRNLNVSRRK